jgi:hypothetical protein
MADIESQDQVNDGGVAGRSRGHQQAVVRGLLTLLGLGLVGAGIAAVFAANSGAGAAALVTAGSLLVLLAALGDQLESLRLGDLEIRLRREADEAAGRGDVEEARVLERAAEIVGGRARRTARAYKSVRGGMVAGPERTAKMEEIIAEARNDADARDINDEEVLGLLWTGSEGARVWALGVLEARPEFATPRAVLDAIRNPDQMFDQYHALVLANRFVRLPNTRVWTLRRVADAVRFQLESGAFGADADCNSLAPEIIRYVEHRLSIDLP